MSYLSPSLFIKEPGRNKNLTLESPCLKKEVKSLRSGDLLEVRPNGGKVSLYSKQNKVVIAEIDDNKIVKKISFTLANKGEIMAIFVSLIKGVKAPKIAAQFLIKSSLPVFPEEKNQDTLKPFTRSGEIPHDEDDERNPGPEAEDANDETTLREETDPLAGLTVVNKEDLSQTEEEI